MKENPKIIKKQEVFNGFNAIDEYDFSPPSMREDVEYTAPINREVVKTKDAVVVLIYCRQEDAFLFCEQFRTGVHFNPYNDDNGFILECVAGMVEDGHTPEYTAIKETEEEAGVKPQNLELFCTAYPSSGRITEKDFFYYTELEQAPETGIYGNADEGEEIKTHLIPRQKTYDMVENFEFLHMQTILAINWFRLNKDDQS